MKSTQDRLNAAHALLQELTSFMAAGIYVPHKQVQRAHRELMIALQQTRREALQRRRKRKDKEDAA